MNNTYKDAPGSMIWGCMMLEATWVPIPNRTVGENDECHGPQGNRDMYTFAHIKNTHIQNIVQILLEHI